MRGERAAGDAPGRPARRPEGLQPGPEGALQRRREPDDPGHRRERELPAGICRGAWIERQRRRRGEQQRVDTRCRSRCGHRGDSGRAHHPGALQRWPGAGQGNIDRDQRQQGRRPADDAQPGEDEEGQRQRHEQHHVLAADREQVREPGRPEGLASRLADVLVLAEDHAPRERRFVPRHAGGDRTLRAKPEAIHDAGRSPAAAAGGACRVHKQLAIDAAHAQVPLEVRGAQPTEAPPQADLRADRERGRPAPPARDPRQQARTAQRPRRNLHLYRRAEGPGPRMSERDRPRVERGPVAKTQGRSVDGREPRRPCAAAPDQQQCREHEHTQLLRQRGGS